MKYRSLILVLMFSALIPMAFAGVTPTLMDSYNSSSTSTLRMRDEHPSNIIPENSAVGQSFTATSNSYLTRVDFILEKTGAPTGNATASLYNHTGVFGVSGVPANDSLVYSTTFDVTELTGNLLLYRFNFSSDQQYLLTSGQNYFIAFRNPTGVAGITLGDFTEINFDGGTPTASGNLARFTRNPPSEWVASASADAHFWVYTAPQPYVAQYTTQFEVNTWNWVNLTVRDPGGIANFQTVDIQVNTTLDTENFTHRWTQATGVFSTTTDLLNVTTLDAVRSFSRIVDQNTTMLNFRFRMFNATTGYCDVNTIQTNDAVAVINFMQLSEFNYAGVSWTAVGDALDSAFSFWGIQDFMDKASVYINGISVYFTQGLIDLVAMITQQMRLILAFFSGFLKVFTNAADAALNLWNTGYSLISGTNTLIDLGIGNFWEWIAFGAWSQAFYIVLFLFWVEQLPDRAKGTGRNTMSVIMQDVNQAINLTSFFVSTFAFIVNEVANWSLRLFDAITGVIPV